VADIAAGGASTEQKQQTQDMLSALQGQRGTGAGLGSNVDQLMATALGTQSANMRSTYANALVNYLQNQAQTAASGSRSLSPSA
jgi:phage baseplate assembly protein W